MSSYTVNRDGSLTPISDSVGDGQTAPCWIVTSGRHAYAANYVGGYVSGFALGSSGQLTHVADTPAVDNPSATTTLDDMAITPEGRTIYQLVPGIGEVRPFQVNRSTGAEGSKPNRALPLAARHRGSSRTVAGGIAPRR